MKKKICILILLCFALLQCGNNIKDFNYTIITDKNTKKALVTCDSWNLYFPYEWKLISRNKTDKGSFIHLRRKMSGYMGTIDCLIKHIPTDTDIKSYSKENFTTITAHLIRSGFTINRFREIIITDLKKSIKQPMTGFSYELTGKKIRKRHLAVSVFLEGNDNILNINFETTPSIFERYKNEIKGIVMSVKHGKKK